LAAASGGGARRGRPKKVFNDDWEHPHDPDAKVTKMKDRRTHLAHKAEHTVDLETQAIVAASLVGANEEDTSSLPFRGVCEPTSPPKLAWPSVAETPGRIRRTVLRPRV